jgi:hypothetical protein
MLKKSANRVLPFGVLTYSFIRSARQRACGLAMGTVCLTPGLLSIWVIDKF